jgi:hypothetical protein
MDVKAHEQYRTDAGDDIIIVPTKEYAMLVSIRKAYFEALEQGIPPCSHPEDMLSGLEILPDMVVCAKCGALLKLEEGGQPGFPTWVRASVHDLEVAIFDTFRPAIEAVDRAHAELADREVTNMVAWSEGVERDNPVLRERQIKRLNELSLRNP